MAKSILRVNTRSRQQRALFAVVITTLLAVVASGLKAYDDASFEWMHSLSLVAMLIAYGVFIVMVRARRVVKPLETTRRNDELLVCGLHPTQFVTIQPTTQKTMASPIMSRIAQGGSGASSKRPLELRPLGALPTRYRLSVRAVAVRNSHVDRKVLEILSHFPNLSILDVQQCSVAPEVWQELVHWEHLKIILANGAVPDSDQRDLHLTLPEVEIVLQSAQIVMVTSLPPRLDDGQGGLPHATSATAVASDRHRSPQ